MYESKTSLDYAKLAGNTLMLFLHDLVDLEWVAPDTEDADNPCERYFYTDPPDISCTEYSFTYKLHFTKRVVKRTDARYIAVMATWRLPDVLYYCVDTRVGDQLNWVPFKDTNALKDAQVYITEFINTIRDKMGKADG